MLVIRLGLILTVSERLQQWSTSKHIFITLVLFALFIFSLPLFYFLYPAANDMISLDDPVLYTSAEILNILQSWGETGRFSQMWFHVTWDLAVPILYSLFFAFIISWLFQKSVKPDSYMHKLNLFAISGGTFDLLENFAIFTLILSYPARIEILVLLKNAFTILKYFHIIILLSLISLGLLMIAWNRFK